MTENILELQTWEERTAHKPEPHDRPAASGPSDVVYIPESQSHDNEEVYDVPEDSFSLLSNAEADTERRSSRCVSLVENEQASSPRTSWLEAESVASEPLWKLLDDGSSSQVHALPDVDDGTSTDVVAPGHGRDTVEEQTSHLVACICKQDLRESLCVDVDDWLRIHDTKDQGSDVEGGDDTLDECRQVRHRDLLQREQLLHAGHFFEDGCVEAKAQSLAVPHTADELTPVSHLSHIKDIYRHTQRRRCFM